MIHYAENDPRVNENKDAYDAALAAAGAPAGPSSAAATICIRTAFSLPPAPKSSARATAAPAEKLGFLNG